jgi:hypothetical protein
MKKHFIGFGFDTGAKGYHFLVVIPKEKDGKVSIYECFHWDPKEVSSLELCSRDLKAEIDCSKWDLLATDVAQVLNERLERDGISVGTWKVGSRTPVERLCGKELLLLVWAVNGYDTKSVTSAILNWRGLSHEERWWLFTMANSIGGSAYDSERGWRKAISYALCDNPTKAAEEPEELFGAKPAVKNQRHPRVVPPPQPRMGTRDPSLRCNFLSRASQRKRTGSA